MVEFELGVVGAQGHLEPDAAIEDFEPVDAMEDFEPVAAIVNSEQLVAITALGYSVRQTVGETGSFVVAGCEK